MQQNINGVDSCYFGDGGTGSALAFPPWNSPRAFNPAQYEPNSFMVPPPPVGLFNPRRQFGYESGSPYDHNIRLTTESLGGHVDHYSIGSAPFDDQLHAELHNKMEIMEAKALAASKSHSEAERRRRHRINNHFAKLRTMLPSTIKTDKASLLAEVIHHVKELKRQTSLISETSPVPTETDELTIDTAPDEYGRPIIKASICCDDRPDLMPDLIKTLKHLGLKTLKAEITTLGGRVKNVLFITGDDDETNGSCDGDIDQQTKQFRISSIEEALKAVMEKSKGDDQSGSVSVKRQRTNVNII